MHFPLSFTITPDTGLWDLCHKYHSAVTELLAAIQTWFCFLTTSDAFSEWHGKASTQLEQGVYKYQQMLTLPVVCGVNQLVFSTFGDSKCHTF